LIIRSQNDNGYLGVDDGELTMTFRTIVVQRNHLPSTGWVTFFVRDVQRWGGLYGLSEAQLLALKLKKKA
jgi:hypothetical protein